MEAAPRPEPVAVPEPAGIGHRLRTERQRQGMTVREIARRVQVSPSLISQIERGKVNPSVSTLWSLVTVLGLTMSELFPEAEPAAGVPPTVRATDGGPVTTPGSRAVINLETGVRWEQLTAGGDALVEFLSVVYPPGAASCGEDSLVSHSGKEYGYVTAGRLGVRIGFDEHELEPGMAISFDASAPHRLWAIGNEPAEAIWIVVGRQGDGRRPHI